MTGEEDGVPAVGRFQLPELKGQEPIQTELAQHCALPSLIPPQCPSLELQSLL